MPSSALHPSHPERSRRAGASFHIPLAHVTNAYVSDFEDLELQYDLRGTNFGLLKTMGVFANPQGLIFVDVGDGDCLVIETRGERYPRIAVQLSGGQDPNALAHEIMRAERRRAVSRLLNS